MKSRPNMRSLGLRVQRPVLPCSALQDPFLMGQLGLAWTKGLQEGEDKRFIQVHQWEMMGNCYGYLWVSMHIYGTSLGNDVEKAMEMAKLLLISMDQYQLSDSDFHVCHGFVHYFSIGSSRKKGDISWGSIASSPQIMGNAGETWKS